MKKKSSSRRPSATEGTSGIFSASLFGSCVGIFCAVILLFACAIICLFSGDPDKLSAPLAFISVITVYFISGFAAVRKRRAALPCGAICGAILCVIFLLISFFISKDLSMGLSLPVSLLIRLSFVAVSVLGALVGTNVDVKKNRRRK